MYIDLKTFCYKDGQKCHNFCILYAKNNIDLIKTSLNLFNLHLFQYRISNFDEIWFTFKKFKSDRSIFYTPRKAMNEMNKAIQLLVY
jgi:hypothetical protein